MTHYVPRPRTCAECGKEKGTTAQRYVENGVWKRGYFHPNCFRILKERLK